MYVTSLNESNNGFEKGNSNLEDKCTQVLGKDNIKNIGSVDPIEIKTSNTGIILDNI